jgi:hypothetical protein
VRYEVKREVTGRFARRSTRALSSLLMVGAVTLGASAASAQRRKPSTKIAAKPSTQTAVKTPAKPRAKTSPTTSSGTLTLSTQPGAAVWVDEVRRGAADTEGRLT